MTMGSPVKRARGYVSPRHAEMRARTRRDILAAAERLFTSRGYVATTIEHIAVEAGVAVPTVYAVFGSKRSVIWTLLEQTLVGDDAPVSVVERLRTELGGVTDVGARQARAARYGRRVVERTAPLYRMMRDAAAVDPEIAEALAEIERRRYEDARAIADLIAPPDATRAQRRRAADVLFAVAGYESYELLVRERRWSARRWEQWMRETIVRELK